MFNWGYALIGFAIGWLGGTTKAAEKRGDQNTGLQVLIGIAFIAFLIFSATFGIEWFFMAIVEYIIGLVVGIKMTR